MWRSWRRTAVIGAAAVAAVGVAGAMVPRLAGQLAIFRVRRVELVGVRYLAPDAVIGALRLAPDASVFADLGLLSDRVRGLAGVADARVTRRYPGALRVVLRETEPVAFAPAAPGGGGGLVAVDARGRPLPFDAARAALDLPIAERADSRVAGVLSLLRAVDPALFGEIELARVTPRGDVLLEWASRRVLLRRDAGPEDIRAVVLVAQDLMARGRRSAELDARYAGQVVVRGRPRG
jgi:cell division septal protein FtsQ